jgi:hypothetical protein
MDRSDERELMARLGHSSPRAAMRYQHAAADRDRDIADRLNVLIESTSRRDAEVIEVRRDGRQRRRCQGGGKRRFTWCFAQSG